ncbi:MAG: S41 family peptidase [Alphaproteobacteria bacterium GM7ARS4]|nr:S41 family peptidase [Alphaproteobacteria bacterium GM7ARS4]
MLFLLCLGFFLSHPAYGETPQGTEAAAKEDKKDAMYRSLEDFGNAIDMVMHGYVEDVDVKALVGAAINGMLQSLDPHSAYLDEQFYEDMQIRTKGKFGGLGINVTMDEGVVKIVSPIDDTPAARAGLQSNDLIIEIDGAPVFGMTLQEAVNLMRGDPGTTIVIKVLRGKEEPRDVTIVRDIIKIKSVRGRLEGDVGYIRITDFNQNTRDTLITAIDELKEQKAKKDTHDPRIKGYILDLRNNPGGLLDQAIAVSDAFLSTGEIVSTRGRNKARIARWDAANDDLIDGLPLVVLINQGSASASEIVAGALQDHKRAIVLGTRSFGKGSVQTIRNLTPASAVRMTTALYYTPSGRSIHKKGIEPDIVVEQIPLPEETEEEDAERRAPTNKTEDADASDDTETNATSTHYSAESQKDFQLLRAIDLLRGVHYFQDAKMNATAHDPSVSRR